MAPVQRLPDPLRANRKPYDFSPVLLLLKMCFLVIYMVYKKNCHWFRRAPTCTTKKRFPLAVYSRLKREKLHAELEKKLKTDLKINKAKAICDQKEAELERLNVKLHNVEEKIR